jgi:hypothetical protein
MVTATATLELQTLDHEKYKTCPNTPGWLKGICDHGNQRWLKLSCKRRDCPVCGDLRKRRIATRIVYGLNQLGNAAWFVGTFDWHIPKKEAVLVQKHFIQWLRRDQGIPIEYAAVWELQQTGRLHLNLLLAPWRYLDQRVLSDKWVTFGGGMVVWIERIDATIAPELTKSYQKLGNYMAKFEQMVREGRGICYSKNWPKLPEINKTHRLGHVLWFYKPDDSDDALEFEQDRKLGFWQEILPGEFSICGDTEECHCFDLAPPNPPSFTIKSQILVRAQGP